MNFKINKPLFSEYESDFQDFQQQVMREMMSCHEEVLKGVLRQLLKREPIPEDAKRLTRYMYEGVHDSYDLAFDGVKVGVVLYAGVSVVFEPVNQI